MLQIVEDTFGKVVRLVENDQLKETWAVAVDPEPPREIAKAMLDLISELVEIIKDAEHHIWELAGGPEGEGWTARMFGEDVEGWDGIVTPYECHEDGYNCTLDQIDRLRWFTSNAFYVFMKNLGMRV